ncbi:MAG TPA: four-carbon acid sugar kinase family protein, partial [Longimicrobiaceae bacterium]|nr:four-carbon acid sugar kinase family protein [Longimicrobiaceae bacterium]
MIVVIADDMSGAAELAGAATRLGYSAEVQTRFTPGVHAGVVCVDSGGRMLSPSAAAAGMERMIRAVLAATPDWIYLKFDSVLRGNILPELRSALRATGLEHALLVTANPGRGRTIRGGDYHIDGVPLHETSFAADPEYPRTTSSVRELLGDHEGGIITPDVEDPRDLALLASGAGLDTLTAGGAEFFEALLIARGAPSNAGRNRPSPAGAWRVDPNDGRSSTLLVCGSLGAWRSRSGEARERGVQAFDIHDDPAAAARALADRGTVLLGIGDRPETRSIPSQELLATLAE